MIFHQLCVNDVPITSHQFKSRKALLLYFFFDKLGGLCGWGYFCFETFFQALSCVRVKWFKFELRLEVTLPYIYYSLHKPSVCQLLFVFFFLLLLIILLLLLLPIFICFSNVFHYGWINNLTSKQLMIPNSNWEKQMYTHTHTHTHTFV